MAVDQVVRKAQNALKLSKIRSKLPPDPKVIDLQVEDYVDMDGEDSLRVLVILDEDVNVEKTSGRDIGDLMNAMRDRVRELGIDRWTYVRFAKPSELAEEEDEDEG